MVSLQETSSSLALTILAEVQILACDRPCRADPASSESSVMTTSIQLLSQIECPSAKGTLHPAAKTVLRYEQVLLS
jgi:hypothetical protein